MLTREKIVPIDITAPSGSNSQSWEVVVMEDKTRSDGRVFGSIVHPHYHAICRVIAAISIGMQHCLDYLPSLV